MRRKNISQVILLTLSIISIPQVDQLKDIDTKIQNVATVTPLSYKDPKFQEKSTKFISGEKLYVSLNSQATGEVINECWLLNSSKDKVSKINLIRSGNNPYNYKGEVNLPQVDGIYYIDVNIKDTNSHTAVQQSIEIGTTTGGNSNTSVSNQVVAQSNGANEGITPTPIVYKNEYTQPHIDNNQTNSNPITKIIKNIIKMIIDKLFVKS